MGYQTLAALGVMTALLLVSTPGKADDTWNSGGGWSGDEPKAADTSAKVAAAGDTLQLLSDTNSTFTTTGLNAFKGNGTLTLDIDPVTTASGQTLKLDGSLSPGNYTTVAVTSSNNYTLSLPNVTTTAPGPKLSPTNANLAIGTLAGNVTLAGSSTDNTLALFTGTYLQQESGTWTLTSDNSMNKWNAGINGGNLVIAPGAAAGSGSISVTGTLSPATGITLPNYLNFGNGSTLNMADDKIGTLTLTGIFSGPNGGSIHLKFDVGPDGVDQLILSATSNTNDIKDYLELNLLPGQLKPGTYKIMSVAQGSLVENHLGFDFTGDPANHDNIVKTKTLGGYTFTLDTLDETGKPSNYQGNYATYTLTIAPAAK